MKSLTVNPIGRVRAEGETFVLELDAKYAPALKELDGFSHVTVLYWCDGCDLPEARSMLTCGQPYVGAPEAMGIFATRSPARPNPIALSTARLLAVDVEQGTLTLDYIDAEDGSPILDIKPYTPSLDRVEQPLTPPWCAKWPGSLEASGEFDWSEVFTF